MVGNNFFSLLQCINTFLQIKDLEREIIPMCIEEHLAIAPWGVAGQGRFKSKTQIEERKQNNDIIWSYTRTGQSLLEHTVSAALEKIGKEHLLDNIKALEITLPEDQIMYSEEQSPFDPGFPDSVVRMDPHRFGQTQFSLQSNYLNLAWVKQTPAIPSTPLGRK
jgi:aryl-alcohol dehydrogenase-like predicted oxidoreductase